MCSCWFDSVLMLETLILLQFWRQLTRVSPALHAQRVYQGLADQLRVETTWYQREKNEGGTLVTLSHLATELELDFLLVGSFGRKVRRAVMPAKAVLQGVPQPVSLQSPQTARVLAWEQHILFHDIALMLRLTRGVRFKQGIDNKINVLGTVSDGALKNVGTNIIIVKASSNKADDGPKKFVIGAHGFVSHPCRMRSLDSLFTCSPIRSPTPGLVAGALSPPPFPRPSHPCSAATAADNSPASRLAFENVLSMMTKQVSLHPHLHPSQPTPPATPPLTCFTESFPPPTLRPSHPHPHLCLSASAPASLLFCSG